MSIKPLSYQLDFSKPAKAHWIRESDVDGGELPFIREYFINDQKISGLFGDMLDPLLADWIDIALCIYLADRVSPRRDGTDHGSALIWPRIFHLTIPVRRLEVWQRSEPTSSLLNALRFFTEDQWRIEFTRHPGEMRPSESQPYLFKTQPPPPIRVALFSGGLDSFAGSIAQMKELPECSFVFVSGATNAVQGSRQRALVRALSHSATRPVSHVTVPYWLRQSGVRSVEERSQRSRGFLFLTLGAATAISVHARQLFVYENGIGAINLPYDATQVGTSNSRGVHPVALVYMATFISHLIEKQFSIENPFLSMTKTEMCSHTGVRSLGEHIRETFSCDGFPVRHRGKQQCGGCTSCLLRRLALEGSGLSEFDPTDRYLRNLSSRHGPANTRSLASLRAMEWQAQKLGGLLKNGSPWLSLSQNFPQLNQVVTEMCLWENLHPRHTQESLLSLYSRYVDEWESFSARSLFLDQGVAA